MKLKCAIVIAVLCLLVAVAAVAWAAGQEKVSAPQVIRAQKFEVVDEKGAVRAEFGLTELAGGGVALCDENGKARAGIAVSDMGPVNLTLTDEHQTPRISMSVHAGITSVQLLSGKMVPLPEALPGGKGSDQEVWDAAEKAFEEVAVRALLLMDDEIDKASFTLFDEQGEAIWLAE